MDMFRPKFDQEDSDSSSDKIILEQSTFKALASKTRVSILKELDQRRKTLTEIATNMNMASATVKEHLENLKDANLIKLKDDGRKWKYYELTGKGKAVLYPERARILVMLGSMLFIIVLSMFTSFYDFNPMMSADMQSRSGAISKASNMAPAPKSFEDMDTNRLNDDSYVTSEINENKEISEESSSMLRTAPGQDAMVLGEVDSATNVESEEMIMPKQPSQIIDDYDNQESIEIDGEKLTPVDLHIIMEQDELGNVEILGINGNTTELTNEEMLELEDMIYTEKIETSYDKDEEPHMPNEIEFEMLKSSKSNKNKVNLLNYFFVFSFIFITVILIQDLIVLKKHKKQYKKELRK